MSPRAGAAPTRDSRRRHPGQRARSSVDDRYGSLHDAGAKPVEQDRNSDQSHRPGEADDASPPAAKISAKRDDLVQPYASN